MSHGARVEMVAGECDGTRQAAGVTIAQLGPTGSIDGKYAWTWSGRGPSA